MRKEPLFLLFYKGPHKTQALHLPFCHIVPAAGLSVLSGKIFFAALSPSLANIRFPFLPPTAVPVQSASKSLGSRSPEAFMSGADGTVQYL